MNKRKTGTILIIFLLLLFVISVIIYTILVTTGVIKFKDELNVLIISSFSCVSTVALGIITVWQTGKANEISELAFKDRVNCDLIPTQEVVVSRETLRTDIVIEFAKKHETEGLYCEIENKVYKHGKRDPYLKLQLAFRTSGSLLENCSVENIYLNKSFNKEQKKLKSYYVKFKILNPQKRLVLAYNPLDGLYYLEIYMREDTLLKKISNAGYFVIDLELKLTSAFSTKRNITYSINLEKINNLENIIKNRQAEKQTLSNIIIHRQDQF